LQDPDGCDKRLLSEGCEVSSVSDDFTMDELVRELEREEARITISKNIRKWNKPATVISGLQDRKDAKDITKALKTKIGTGGTYKDGQIILQGDHRETVKNILISMGFVEQAIEVM
jgi:translation initiation factor 1